MKRLRITLLAAGVAAAMLAMPAAAQITVTTLAEGDDPVEKTERIRVSRFLDLTEVDLLAVGDVLSEFDQITALSEDVRIELTCSDGSVLEFGEGFRVMVQAAEGEDDCAVIVTLAGLGDVLTGERTETNLGGTALITTGTRYAFRLRRDGEQPRQEVLVFDGEVEVRKPVGATAEITRERIPAGRVVELSQGTGRIATRAIRSGEIEWWAKRYASFDVVKARAAGAEIDPWEAAALRNKLTDLHAAVLSEPKKFELRAELAATQSSVRVHREALYHTDKIQRIEPEVLRRHPDLENLVRQRRDVLRPLNP